MRLRTNVPDDAHLAHLEKRIPEIMASAAVPGLSIALVSDGRLLWCQTFGYRSLESKQPLTIDTVFEAASLSKPVFAYLALRLCEGGVLDLDAPLIEYLPAARRTEARLFGHVINEPRLHRVTLRHVLSHTPGFPNWAPKGEGLKIHIAPGERFSYSGEGYVYLQRVIEHVTGQAPHDYIQTQLLEPLGMQSSSYLWTQAESERVAQGHDEHGTVQQKRAWPEMNAAASLHCTPTDFARFMMAVMRPSPDNPYHLSSAGIDEMLRPQVQVNDDPPWRQGWPRSAFRLNQSLSWGLGWGLQHHASGNSFWHWGDNGAFRAFAVGFRAEGLGAVVMANSANGPKIWRDVLSESIGGVYPALAWLENAA